MVEIASVRFAVILEGRLHVRDPLKRLGVYSTEVI